MKSESASESGTSGRKLAPLTEWRMPVVAPVAAPVSDPPRWNIKLLIGVGAGALVLMVGAIILFNQPDTADLIAATPVAAEAPPQLRSATSEAHAPVTLPSGLQIDRNSVLNYDLAAWLATKPATPRTFLFDRLEFAPGTAAIRDDGRPSLQVLTQILTAYPQARVVISANGPGSLAQERSVAIRDALLALATDPQQLSVRAGDGSEGAPRLEVSVEMGVTSDLDA